MLLFVVSALVVFHFALPATTPEATGDGLLWIGLVFTALLGLTRAFVAEREQGVMDGLALATPDRSAIWLGKSVSIFAFLALAEAVALPAYWLFFQPVGWQLVAAVVLANIGIAAVGTLLAAMAAASRARELLLPLLFLPLGIPVIVGGVGARWRTIPAATSPFSRSTTSFLRFSPGRVLSTSLRNNRAALLAVAALLLLDPESCWRSSGRRRTPTRLQPADLLHPRPGRADRLRVLRLGSMEGAAAALAGDERYDLESYVAVHLGVIFGVLTLATGSIWAKASWDVWWSWGERQLVLFLVLFLFYSAYFMLRYSVEPGRRRANLSAVYALFGVVLIPISFLAIRLAEGLIHPVVFDRDGPNMENSMFFAFCVCLAGTLALAGALYRVELAGKRLDSAVRELRELLG